ncbi:hypothetical protein KAR91_86855 [Candidatus Pacearchaeota archaeon]|nr:hypothetical protein [Candidatus Pacearchaeota archaeon]
MNKEKWPTKHLEKEISSLPLTVPQKPMKKLSSKWQDITQTDPQAAKLASENLPEISALGMDLSAEVRSEEKGGLTYRVLANEKSLENTTEAVIQYLMIWSKQRIAITFANFLLPIWILIGLTIYINTDILFYKDPFILIELVNSTQILGIIYGAVTGRWLITLLCLWFIMVGVRNVIKWIQKGVVSMRVLFGIYGILYLLGAFIEYRLDLSPLFTCNLGDILNIRNYSVIVIKMSWTPFLAIILSSAFYLLVKNVPSLKKKIGGHKMDYAPIFIYLKRDTPLKNWQKEVLFDKFHYCVKESIAPKDDDVLVMEGRWHSFELYRKNKWLFTRISVIISFIFFSMSILVSIYGILNGIDILEIIEPFQLPTQIELFIQRLFYPFVIIGTGYWFSTRYPTNLIEKELRTAQELKKTKYYLSSYKLHILWTLKSKEAHLTIKDKLQFPETYRNKQNKLDWLSFYDDDMEEEKWADILCEFGLIARFKRKFWKERLAKELVKSGERLQKQNMPEKALRRYEKAIQLKPDFTQARLGRAAFFQESNRIDEAQNDIDIVFQSQPNNAKAQHIQGLIFEKTDEKEKAAEAFKKAKRLGYKKSEE